MQPTTLPQKLILPIARRALSELERGQLYRRQPLPGVANDYRGGSFVYDGHDGYDFVLPDFASMDAGMPVDGCRRRYDHRGRGRQLRPPDVLRQRRGQQVVEDLGNGWTAEYLHFMNSSIDVQVGQTVQAGQLLGLAGSSGDSTMAHLHFDLRYDGDLVETFYEPNTYWVNPLPYQGDVPPSITDQGTTNSDPTDDMDERPDSVTVFPSSSGWAVWYWFDISYLDPSAQITIDWYWPDGSLAVSNPYIVSSFVDHGGYEFDLTLPPSVVGRRPGHLAGGCGRRWNRAGPDQLRGDQWRRRSDHQGLTGQHVHPRQSDDTDRFRHRQRELGGSGVDVHGREHRLEHADHERAELAAGLHAGRLVPRDDPRGSRRHLHSPALVGIGRLAVRPDHLPDQRPERPDLRLQRHGHGIGQSAGRCAADPALRLRAGDRPGIGPLVLDPGAILSDASPQGFDGGSLTISMASGGTGDDRLSILNQGTAAGQIGFNGSGVYYGSTQIGTASIAAGPATLTIALNDNATLAAVQALLDEITYQNVATSPTTAPRYVRFSAVDGAGLASNLAIEMIVNSGMAIDRHRSRRRRSSRRPRRRRRVRRLSGPAPRRRCRGPSHR